MMKRFICISLLALLTALAVEAQSVSVNYDTETVAAMTGAYAAETVAESYYTKQVNDILNLYTTAEVASAGIFASKYLDRKALTELGLWSSSQENYYYRRIYSLVGTKIMPKIWKVAGMMLHSPQTALYWGTYLLKVCDETKSLCMQFESVVSNSRLSFHDIDFLELRPEIKALFKLSEAGNIDWKAFLDELGNISHNFTKENLEADIENLYNMGVGLAGAGVGNFTQDIMGGSSFNDLLQGKVSDIANVALNAYDFYRQLDSNMEGTLLGLVGGKDNIAGLFNLANYNLTSWIDDYAREAMGQFYTQRWYIYRSNSTTETVCDYVPPTDDNSIIHGSQWYRIPYSSYTTSSDEQNIVRNSESYAGWSAEKVRQMNAANDGYNYQIYYSRMSYTISRNGTPTQKAYAYSIKVVRTQTNTEVLYEDYFDSYSMDLATFKAQLNARLSEFNDNEEGKTYTIGCDEKHYYQATDAEKLKGTETVIISVTCHNDVKLMEGSTQYKCSSCGGSLNAHSKSCTMKTTLDSDDNADFSELDALEQQYNQEVADLQLQIDALELQNANLLRQIANATVEEAVELRQQYNTNKAKINQLKAQLETVKQKQEDLARAKAEAEEGEKTQTDDYYRIPAIMHDCKTAYNLTWQDAGYWSGYTFIRTAKAPNINGTVVFKATLSIARRPKYFLGIKIHRAIMQISWELTSEYTDSEVVDILDLDPSKPDAQNAVIVNNRLSEIARAYPLCSVSSEYIKSVPDESNSTPDTYHLLWSSDRLEIARQIDTRLTRIYADLVCLEKMMHYKRSIIDVLKDIAPYINENQGRRYSLLEKARKRWLRGAANTHHSVDYNGKYEEDDDE